MQQGDEGPDHLVDLRYTPMHQGYLPWLSDPTGPGQMGVQPPRGLLPTPGPHGGATARVKGQGGPTEEWRTGWGWGRKTRTPPPGKVISGLEVMVSWAESLGCLRLPHAVPSRGQREQSLWDEPISIQGANCDHEAQGPDCATLATPVSLPGLDHMPTHTTS